MLRKINHILSSSKANTIFIKHTQNYFSTTADTNDYRLAVSTAVILENNILLIRRENEPNKGRLCFPGGKIEKGEHYQNASIREVFEETGLKVSLLEIHLLNILYVREYLIFTLISSPNDYKIKSYKEFKFDNIIQRWYSKEEAMCIDDDEFVPGLKELIPKVFDLYQFNNMDKMV